MHRLGAELSLIIGQLATLTAILRAESQIVLAGVEGITLTDNAQIMSLFAMTPYYWRTSPEDAEKLSAINELSTEVDIIISVYKNEKDKI